MLTLLKVGRHATTAALKAANTADFA